MPDRKFVLFDLMIVVANLAIALAWQRWLAHVFEPRFRLGLQWRPNGRLTGNQYYYLWVQLCGPILVLMTTTGIAFRLRSPRPGWSELRVQPGFVAAIAVMSWVVPAAVILSVLNLVVDLGYTIPFNKGEVPIIIIDKLTEIGTIVATAWATMLCIGQWRPEPGWIDRYNRVVGFCWIAYTVLLVVVMRNT
ncbi:hypothetical protein SAMN05444166_0834 [Singulisphaera sp. GP187]|uniref:hypothetical protein n=1 Tax=Singulisphaera sp. GP187 TaxID=1882752 RepID=UPI000926264F|nr:hypothetical protein [Singulisphaera sp. GP187]SIN78480.1 hypothetical protein SAMN05444166_0834 [Singulisphaera sp. GP187]